jgi:hypothetical protein
MAKDTCMLVEIMTLSVHAISAFQSTANAPGLVPNKGSLKREEYLYSKYTSYEPAADCKHEKKHLFWDP